MADHPKQIITKQSYSHPVVISPFEGLVSDRPLEQDALERSVLVLGHQLHRHKLRVSHYQIFKRLQAKRLELSNKQNYSRIRLKSESVIKNYFDWLLI
jgi:hypothetical protein